MMAAHAMIDTVLERAEAGKTIRIAIDNAVSMYAMNAVDEVLSD